MGSHPALLHSGAEESTPRPTLDFARGAWKGRLRRMERCARLPDMKTATIMAPCQVSRHLFTVAEYHEMVRVGILREDDRLELIHGEILETPPIGNEHGGCTDRLTRRFTALPERHVQVRIQGAVELAEHEEPQPDVALLKYRADYYSKRAPGPQDTFLAIEVSDTTLEHDRKTKMPLYASSGIAESWIVNLPEQCIEVYRKPSRRGYREVKRYSRGDTISPLAFPELTLSVDDVLGPT